MPKLNIVYIMADDMGFGDLSCYNPEGKIPTPNMDRLAKQGMKFTDAHAPSSVCTPTRYGVLTGRHCWRSQLKEGVIGGYAAPLIEPERLTIASLLKKSGYHTACIGKWHIGATFHNSEGTPTEEESEIDFKAPITGGPVDLGFDYAFWNSGCGTCAPPYGFIENRHFIHDKFNFFNPGSEGFIGVGAFGQWEGMMAEDWVTKDTDIIITEKACHYIREKSNEEEPFFLFLTPNAPHEPCLDRFTPDFAKGKSHAGPRGDLVWLFDWTVGQIMDSLKEHGLEENTLIVITSDNGALPGDFIIEDDGSRVTSGGDNPEYQYHTHGHKSNGEWRGYKSHIWDGGHRVPYLVRWPGVVTPNTSTSELICLTDTMATFAKVIGAELPHHAGEDSFSTLPILESKGGSGKSLREDVIHHSSFGVYSIRKGKWKLILDCSDSGGWPTPRGSKPIAGNPGQLFNLEEDPGEMCNLWNDHLDIVFQLKERLEQYQRSERSAPAI
jgi:arylsulfatase A